MGPCRATEAEAVAGDVRFVPEGKGYPSPWAQRERQVFLGLDPYVGDMQRKVPAERDLREVPQARRGALPRPLADCARRYPDRDRAIATAYATGGYSLREIGDSLGLHDSRVSKILGRLASAGPEA